MDLIITLIIGLLAGAILVFLILRKSPQNNEKLTEDLKLMLPELLQKTQEQLVLMADQKLGAEKREIKTDMENKRSEIERLIKDMKMDLKESKLNLENTEKDRISKFSELTTALQEQRKLTDQLHVSTEQLRKLLSDNQLRGQFGEKVAEDLLKMAGFVKGQNYEFNKEQSGSETRPDFSIFLPDGTRINVDAKFPYSNLQQSLKTEDKAEKEKYRKLFEQDIKQKIKQVTSRDYINPEDKTVDFVILFIPNEMIFSYIYDKLNDVWQEAMEKKVIFAGPFTFTALLRIIKQAYDNFTLQSNIAQVVTNVRMLEKEFVKFSDEFEKVGDRIESLNKQYESVSRTRVNQMTKIMDKVQLEDEKVSEPKLLD